MIWKKYKDIYNTYTDHFQIKNIFNFGGKKLLIWSEKKFCMFNAVSFDTNFFNFLSSVIMINIFYTK